MKFATVAIAVFVVVLFAGIINGFTAIRTGGQVARTIQSLQWYRYSSFDSSEATQSLAGSKGLKTIIPKCNYLHIEAILHVNGDIVTSSSISLNEYQAAFTTAKSNGYKIIFRIAVQPSMEYVPTDTAAFFASYTSIVKSFAQFCSENQVDSLCIGVEMTQLEAGAYDGYWDNMISQVRSVYLGQLWYETNNWYKLTGATDSLDQKLSRPWFSRLSYIGVSAYFVMAKQIEPTVESLKANWHSYVGGSMLGADIVGQIQQISSHYNKNILIVSGLSSGKNVSDNIGACMRPYAWAWTDASNTEQTNWYEALFETFSNQPWIAGFSFDNAWQTRHDAFFPIDFSIQNKPTVDIVNAWFK